MYNFTFLKAKTSQKVTKCEFHEGRPSIEEQYRRPGIEEGCMPVRVRTPLLMLKNW